MTSKYQKPYQSFFEKSLGYSIMSDPNQLDYIESILAPLNKSQIVFCEAKAGTGKTSMAVASAYYMLTSMDKERDYTKILYFRNPVDVKETGFLPGGIDEKENHLFTPFVDAINDVGVRLGNSQDLFKYMSNEKDPKIETFTTSHLRGKNFSTPSIVIIDEAQNFDLTELRTVLTRFHDNSKIIVIGSSLQVDNHKMKRYFMKGRYITAFELFKEHFIHSEVPTHVAHLIRNYRGKLANTADDVDTYVSFLEAVRKSELENSSHPSVDSETVTF